MHPEKLKNNPSASFVVLVALVFVLSYGSAEARSAHSHEHQPLFSNQNTDSRCPLIHHPDREVCPLAHHGRVGNVLVIKSCDNGSTEGVSSSFSKETVAVGAICDSRLSLSERTLVSFPLFYNALLPNPLDHPPRPL